MGWGTGDYPHLNSKLDEQMMPMHNLLQIINWFENVAERDG
jgi:hypothetical protein